MSLFPQIHPLIQRLTGHSGNEVEVLSVGRAVVAYDWDGEEDIATLPDTQAAVFYRHEGDVKVVVVMVDEFKGLVTV